MLLLPIVLTSIAGSARSHDKDDHSLLVQLDSTVADVLKAVQKVTEDEIIHGTYSYEKEKTLYGAKSANSSHVFGQETEPGKAFYKVADKVLAPKFFRDSGDIGTITVRYLVQSVNPTSTSLRIDAIFVDARLRKHASLGSVESAEYAAIQDQLKLLEAEGNQGEKATQQAQAPPEQQGTTLQAPLARPGVDSSRTVEELEKRVDELRRQVELRVKESDTPLRSAPFRSASTITTLPAKTEVLVVVLTPYWYGVETEDGRRGWIHRSQLEPFE